MFCPKCGAILVPKKEKGKNVLSCSCGYSGKDVKAEIKEVLEEEKEIEVLDENVGDAALPLTEATCPKCKHHEARYWLRQTRAGD